MKDATKSQPARAPRRHEPRPVAAAPVAGLTAAFRERLRDPRQPVLLPLLLLLASRVLFMLAQPYANEDAYIAFRYASHLVHGLGLTYNAGEHVMGFTSLPWTLWCALGLSLHVSPVLWTQLSSVAADAVSLVLVSELLAGAFGTASAWAFAAFFSTWPLFAASAVSGLECNAFFLALAGSAALIERRSAFAGPVLGLLAVWRPEGLFASVLLAARADRRAQLTAAAIAIGTLAALALYYGSPIPQSVVAKAALYGTPGPWLGRHWWDWLFPAPLGRYPTSSEGIQLMPMAILLAASALRGASELWSRRWHASMLLAGAGVLVWLSYCVLGVAYFWWYMVVPVAAIAVLAAVGLPRIVNGRLVPAMAGVYLVGVWTVALPLYLGRAGTEYRNNMSVAGVINAAATSQDVVMLEPIGMIGYETGLRVIDEVGLVTPSVVRQRLLGAGWYADFVASQRPAWLVLRQDVLAGSSAFAGTGAPFRSAVERDRMLADYHLVWPDHPAEGIALVVFRRNP